MGAGLITYNLLFIAILKCIRLLVLYIFKIFNRTWKVVINIAIANKLRKYIVIIERKNKFKIFFFLVKLTLGDLNPIPCPLLPTSIYICGMTIAPRVHGGQGFFIISIFCCKNKVRWEKFNPITWFVVAVLYLLE